MSAQLVPHELGLRRERSDHPSGQRCGHDPGAPTAAHVYWAPGRGGGDGWNPLANDNDVNVAYWGRPTDDVWFPATVAVPPLPPRGVNGAVVPLTPASKAEGSVAGLPKGHRATVYAVDDEGGVARVATTGHAFTLGGLRNGRYTIFCTTRDGFPYDFGRPDTPTGSVRVTVPAAAAPDAPLVRIPTCRPIGAGSPTLVRALKAWDPNAELGGQPLP